MRTQVRFYGPLTDLAEEVELEVLVADPRSVKDLIEALGVPHPEVGLIVVDGEPVRLDHRVEGGERVAVYPPFRELDLGSTLTVEPAPIAPRFVADVHLGTLARRLRLLGFDTWYRTDAHDAELTDVAVGERRILLTRDRGLLMRRVIEHGYCPRSHDPDLQLAEVVDRYDLAGCTAPMSRCVRCNATIHAVEAAEVAHLVPPRTRDAFDTYARCAGCGQVYWPGAHQRALLDIVNHAAPSGGDGPDVSGWP